MRWSHFTPRERIQSFSWFAITLFGWFSGCLPIALLGFAGVVYTAFRSSGPAHADTPTLRRLWGRLMRGSRPRR